MRTSIHAIVDEPPRGIHVPVAVGVDVLAQAAVEDVEYIGNPLRRRPAEGGVARDDRESVAVIPGVDGDVGIARIEGAASVVVDVTGSPVALAIVIVGVGAVGEQAVIGPRLVGGAVGGDAVAVVVVDIGLVGLRVVVAGSELVGVVVSIVDRAVDGGDDLGDAVGRVERVARDSKIGATRGRR